MGEMCLSFEVFKRSKLELPTLNCKLWTHSYLACLACIAESGHRCLSFWTRFPAWKHLCKRRLVRRFLLVQALQGHWKVSSGNGLELVSNWPSILTLRPPITPDSLVSTRISLVTLILPFSKAAPEHLILLSCCFVNSSPPVILPVDGIDQNQSRLSGTIERSTYTWTVIQWSPCLRSARRFCILPVASESSCTRPNRPCKWWIWSLVLMDLMGIRTN